MSVSTEVQRTLVKSPPELWTELSNPEALARHLGDFGEIRITKTEPETKVEWEAEEASGVVQLKQSGWGTKVTLSVTRTPATPEQPPAPACLSSAMEGPRTGEPAVVAEPEPIAATERQPVSIVEPEPIAVQPEPEPVAIEPESEPVAPEPEPVATAPEPEPIAATEPQSASVAEPEPQLGFFARLFRKRKVKKATLVEPKPAAVELQTEPEPSMAAESDADPKPEPELVALAAPEPVYPVCLPPDMRGPRTGAPPTQPEASEPTEDLATELESLEEQMTAETTELLTSVLDRLGAAHHRPFSRG